MPVAQGGFFDGFGIGGRLEKKKGKKFGGVADPPLQFGAGAENVGVTGRAEDVVDGGIVFGELSGFTVEQADVESASAEKARRAAGSKPSSRRSSGEYSKQTLTSENCSSVVDIP